MQLHGNKRLHITKGDNNRLRKEGMIPAVMYGRDFGSTLVEFAELDVYDVIKKAGEHGLVDIEIDGKNEKTIIKEVQRDPVTRKIIHMDLQRVNENEKVKTKVPVTLKGESGLKLHDAIAELKMDGITVYCSPKSLPKNFTVDVSDLIPHDKIRVCDMEISNEIQVLDDLNSVVVLISAIKDRESDTETPKEIEVVYQEDITV